jgi:outer membrane lipoprotein SlyB
MLGSFVGQGTGRDIAMVAGAVGGGIVGNTENRYIDKRAGQHVTDRLPSGVAIAITQPADPNPRVGDRFRIDGSGQRAHVVRA